MPTITVADRDNSFFGTVDAVLTLSVDRAEVAALTVELGEDQELIKRTLSYAAERPAGGTSLKLTRSGNRFVGKGRVSSAEDGVPAGTMPVTLAVTCAGTW